MLLTDSVSLQRREDGEYHLQWRHSHPNTSVTVSVVEDHCEPSNYRSLEQVRDSGTRIGGLHPERRHLFHLRDQHGNETLVAERGMPFEGTPNFRDFGGYHTSDGRRVKWGYLYRSGQLSGLTECDLRLLSSLDLDVVCDFRRVEEQERDPSQLPSPGPDVVSLSITPGSNSGFLTEASSYENTDRQAMFDFMVEINRDFALQQAQAFGRMFELLLRGEGTRMLVHCAAGKDRTGFAAAIVLLALGVPRATVMADYLLTAEYFKPESELGRLRAKYDMDLEAEVMMPVLEVYPEYLQSALDAIDEQFASVDDYLERQLGVDASAREALRNLYLY
jgi:protein-tyrosine phosphatase